MQLVDAQQPRMANRMRRSFADRAASAALRLVRGCWESKSSASGRLVTICSRPAHAALTCDEGYTSRAVSPDARGAGQQQMSSWLDAPAPEQPSTVAYAACVDMMRYVEADSSTTSLLSGALSLARRTVQQYLPRRLFNKFFLGLRRHHQAAEALYISQLGSKAAYTSVDEGSRMIVVSWLVEVAEEFGLQQETLHSTIALLDRFL
eukprot:GHUV01020720.1.p1 GENE.GHUV01020720.1~~GHUV01020720.1.p1  ORF type:complete len:206 (+),score=30.60 GHUV01020720.1:559-1176(+)